MSLMRDEALSCAARGADFLVRGLEPAREAGRLLAAQSTRRLELLGRGSSGHVCTSLRYLFARHAGLDVSDAMPSLANDPGGLRHLAGGALLVVSQSGRSPDLLQYAATARSAGARVIALLNDEASPLAEAAHSRVPLFAGPELSVAATKSVVLSLLAGLGVLSACCDDPAVLPALRSMPGRLDAATTCNWSALSHVLVKARAAYFVARGAELGVAQELALKVAEVTGVPALAFSAAEFLHGPLGAVSAATPVIGLAGDPQSLPSVHRALQRAAGQGAATLLAAPGDQPADTAARHLPLPAGGGTLGSLVLALVPGYLAIEAAARAMGRDPDRPMGLAKITETL